MAANPNSIPFPIIGGSVKSIANEVSYERSLNLCPIPIGLTNPMNSLTGANTQVSKWALVHSPGISEIDDTLTQQARGIYTASGQTYMVCDQNVYRITLDLSTLTASHTLIGTLGSSAGVVNFADNPTQIIIVDGTENGYIINLADDTFTTLTADDNFFGGTHVVYMDGFFIYNVINSSFIRASSLNDGTTWNSLDVATAENHPDGVVGLAVTKNELWVFGTDTIEIWDDTANQQGFPFEPRTGAYIVIGTKSPYSIVQLDNFVMFVDSRGFVVKSQVSPYVYAQSSGYELATVSTVEIQTELASYSTLGDLTACTYNDRGRIVYQLTSPSEHATLCYDVTNFIWCERSYFDPYYEQHREHLVQFHALYNQYSMVCGLHSGKLYLQDASYYTDNGDIIHRLRRCAPLTNGGYLLPLDKVELRVTCPANSANPGDNPQISMQYSVDGGHHWSDVISRPMGQIGQTLHHVIWRRLGSATEWVFQFSIAEPLPITLIEAYARASYTEQ